MPNAAEELNPDPGSTVLFTHAENPLMRPALFSQARGNAANQRL